MDALFEIEEIGQTAAPQAGLPDSCELCGHCQFLRLLAGRRQAAKAGREAGEAGETKSNLDPSR
jgi:hypothetical protein